MPNGLRVTVAAAALYVCASAQASEQITYTYDIYGRLIGATASGGPANGENRQYGYDAADNRTSVQISGVVTRGSVTIVPVSAVANVSSVGVTLGVTISGSSPSGMVTFTENGNFLGSAFVSQGQASVILEGFPVGTHTITASYAGDASNAPTTFQFTIRVQNLMWLPAVLQLLLSN
jgi:hypothetical protein